MMHRVGFVFFVLLVAIVSPVSTIAHPMVIRSGTIEWNEFVIAIRVDGHEHDEERLEDTYARALSVVDARGERIRLLSTTREEDGRVVLVYEATNRAISIGFAEHDLGPQFPRQLQLTLNAEESEQARLVQLSPNSLPVVLERMKGGFVRDMSDRMWLPRIRVEHEDDGYMLGVEVPLLLLRGWELFLDVPAGGGVSPTWADDHSPSLKEWFADSLEIDGATPEVDQVVVLFHGLHTRDGSEPTSHIAAAMARVVVAAKIPASTLGAETTIAWVGFTQQLQRLEVIGTDQHGKKTRHTINPTENAILSP